MIKDVFVTMKEKIKKVLVKKVKEVLVKIRKKMRNLLKERKTEEVDPYLSDKE